MPPHLPRADGVLHHDGGPGEAEEQPLAFVRHRALAGGAGLAKIDEERVARAAEANGPARFALVAVVGMCSSTSGMGAGASAAAVGRAAAGGV